MRASRQQVYQLWETGRRFHLSAQGQGRMGGLIFNLASLLLQSKPSYFLHIPTSSTVLVTGFKVLYSHEIETFCSYIPPLLVTTIFRILIERTRLDDTIRHRAQHSKFRD